jgi:hypothetical protein
MLDKCAGGLSAEVYLQVHLLLDCQKDLTMTQIDPVAPHVLMGFVDITKHRTVAV